MVPTPLMADPVNHLVNVAEAPEIWVLLVVHSQVLHNDGTVGIPCLTALNGKKTHVAMDSYYLLLECFLWFWLAPKSILWSGEDLEIVHGHYNNNDSIGV